MADVWLPRFAYERHRELPPVCVCCGAPAAMRMPKKIVRSPATTDLIRLPFCDAHKNYWKKRNVFIGANAGTWLVLTNLLLAVVPLRGTVAILISVCWLAVCIAWALIYLKLSRSSIHIKELGPHHFILAGVSAEFAEALQNDREGNAGLRQLALEAKDVADLLAPEDSFQPPETGIQPQSPP